MRGACQLFGWVAALVCLSGCDYATRGDFDGVGFSPGGSLFAVADRHDFIEIGGALTPVRRGEANQTLRLSLSGARGGVRDEWRRYSAADLLTLRKELCSTDGVFLQIPLASIADGAEWEMDLEGPGSTGSVSVDGGTFEAAVVVGLPDAVLVAEQGLGSAIHLKLRIEEADATPGGEVRGELEIKRARGADQSGEVATGEVTVAFRAPVVPERLGKSNLAISQPIMRCAAEVGPVRAGACQEEPPLPFVDATGVLEEL